MSKKNEKGSLELFEESLTPEERRRHEQSYKELLISEMIIAAMENDDVSVRELAKMAGVSKTTVQNLRSGISHAAVSSLFKIFKSLGYTIVATKGNEEFPIVVPDIVETHMSEEVSATRDYVQRLARNKH